MKRQLNSRLLSVATVISLAMLAPSAMNAGAQDADAPTGGARGGAGDAGGGGSAEAFVQRLMGNDANGDGKLSREEVPASFADRLFEAGDADKDGLLTREELLAIGASFGPSRGQGAPTGQARGEPGAGQQEQVTFRGYMNQAGRGMRALQRSAFDTASRDSDLQAVGNIQAALVGAKSRSTTLQMAAHVKERYNTDEVGFRSDVHRGLLKAIAAAVELELAILDGDSAKAKACLQKLDDAELAGHDAFQEAE